MATSRKAISKKQRFEILKRDKFMCRYCGAKAPDVLLHIEHIQPIAKGGTNDLENLIAACEGCNQGKGARLLSDNSAIEKSRDLLAKSQAEIDQLEEMIRWRKTIANKKSRMADFVITSLEDIADASFSDEAKANIMKVYNKYGYDKCADYIAEYVQDFTRRNEAELKTYTFAQYIDIQEKRNTVEGKKKYLIGIAKNCIAMKHVINFSEWLHGADLSVGAVEELIQELKRLHPTDQMMSVDDFIGWWHPHYMEFEGSDSCCDYHYPAEDWSF